ncbi:MAG: pyrroline-5-carboxylate reductase [Myxococcaceae bacterium]
MNQVLLVGCGNLGKAFLKAWAQNNEIKKIHVIQPSLSAQSLFAEYPQITFYAQAELLPIDLKPDALIIAFKPGQFVSAITAFSRFFSNTLLISLLAGTSTKALQEQTGTGSQWIRIMPNVAAQVKQSASLAFAPHTLSATYQQSIDTLFGATGKLFQMPSEQLFDFMTAISGCGPAYFFLMAEIMTNAAIQLGLEKTLATHLVQQTLLGSACLATPESSFEKLRDSVTSKGGMTQAALSILEPDLEKSLEKAIWAALNRQKELSA